MEKHKEENQKKKKTVEVLNRLKEEKGITTNRRRTRYNLQQ
jgi:hypothetical protein